MRVFQGELKFVALLTIRVRQRGLQFALADEGVVERRPLARVGHLRPRIAVAGNFDRVFADEHNLTALGWQGLLPVGGKCDALNPFLVGEGDGQRAGSGADPTGAVSAIDHQRRRVGFGEIFCAAGRSCNLRTAARERDVSRRVPRRPHFQFVDPHVAALAGIAIVRLDCQPNMSGTDGLEAIFREMRMNGRKRGR